MAPPTNGRKFKNTNKVKNDAKSLKRKRDIEDHEKLQKAIDELVSAASILVISPHSLS